MNIAQGIDVETLKTRLNVCQQQLECNSLINTTKRKETLRNEIKLIKLQLAQALGIKDDDDHSDTEQSTDLNEEGSDSMTTRCNHLPSISSLGFIRPSSPFLGNPHAQKESLPEAPPISSMRINDANGSSSASGSGSVFDSEVASVHSALIEAGEGEMGLEALLMEQTQMEQRLADLKRRREEEDEAFARSLQEEESLQGFFQDSDSLSKRAQYTGFSSTFSSSPTPISSSSTSFSSSPSSFVSTPQPVQSKLDRARQERMDAEMAKLFAEAEGSSISFNLAVSPKKQALPENQSTGLALSAPQSKRYYSIFEDKRRKYGGVSDSPTPIATSSASTAMHAPSTTTYMPSPYISSSTFNATPVLGILGSSTTEPKAPGSVPAETMVLGPSNTGAKAPESAPRWGMAPDPLIRSVLPMHSASILNSTQDRKFQPSSIDLTQRCIDLTKQVHEISDDEEGVGSSSTGSSLASKTMMQIGSLIDSSTQLAQWNEYQHRYGIDDFEDEYGYDSENDHSGDIYDSWMHQQTEYWTNRYQPRDSARQMTQAQSETELRELLANIQAAEEEIAPKDRTGTPEGMASNMALLEHQKIGLTWLQKMEEGSNRGGILADDMGLGKTIQSIALIVSRPAGEIDDTVIWDDRDEYNAPPPESKLVKTKATLVVAPVALIYQWEEEIKAKTQPGLVRTLVHHGKSKVADPEILRRYDANEMGYRDPNPNKCKSIGALFKVKFHRVILDEAHLIKNKHTKMSRACTALAATHRLCLTGTPIQNNIDELYSLIRFLNIKPYCDWDQFRDKISTPMKKTRQYGHAMQRVQALMKAICLRRTKTSQVDGKPILQLPDRNVEKVPTPFSIDERAFYTALEDRTKERFNAYVRAGTVMKNYSNILVLLLRLRQACCHPHLIRDFETVREEDAPDAHAHIQQLLDNLLEDIRRRLMDHTLEGPECPICMDIGDEMVILSACGHIYCRVCITAHLSRHVEDEDRKCPECRHLIRKEDFIPVTDFNARFRPAPPDGSVTDPKGKGKAVVKDESEAGAPDKLPGVDVPEALNQWISSSKIDSMIEVVKSVIAKGEKIIVFSQFTSLLDLMETPLREEKIKYLKYDGKMNVDQRNNAVHTMNDDPTYPLMLISLKCGSLGLNLTVANHVVIMDPWWNPGLENQAIDRVHRIGQSKSVFVHRLCIPDTVEDRILLLQEKKKALADGALGEGAVPKLAKLGMQELMYLFRGY
ncbi:hypothetical protein BG011_004149 [Mortierella polycephala]|uniref:Uncharacterized protein n=1 Tax=Mortierella polycephala TaxID=41804 RepID=A0A9P6U2T2_9FUNG|nr:hypothetical protein BG011_004149 [Mortierella polycephala]